MSAPYTTPLSSSLIPEPASHRYWFSADGNRHGQYRVCLSPVSRCVAPHPAEGCPLPSHPQISVAGQDLDWSTPLECGQSDIVDMVVSSPCHAPRIRVFHFAGLEYSCRPRNWPAPVMHHLLPGTETLCIALAQ